MSKKNNKVSIRSLDKLLNSLVGENTTQSLTFELEDSVVDVAVRKYISTQEANDFVDVVLSGAFHDNPDGSCEYSDVMKQYAWNLAILTYFTNIKVEIGADRLYAMIYGSNMMDQIIACISNKQLNDLNSAISAGIKYKMSLVASMQSMKTNALMDKIDRLVESMSLASNAIRDIPEEQLKEAVNKIAAIDEKSVIHALTNDRGGENNGKVD